MMWHLIAAVFAGLGAAGIALLGLLSRRLHWALALPVVLAVVALCLVLLRPENLLTLWQIPYIQSDPRAPPIQTRTLISP